MNWTVWLGPLFSEDVMGSVRDQLYNRVECRVGLVGDRGVGKTALVSKFCGEEVIKVNLFVESFPFSDFICKKNKHKVHTSCDAIF